MTEKDEPSWPPAAFMDQLQSMSESASEGQMELFRRWMDSTSAGSMSDFTPGGMGMGTAVFKTRVQSGGRISIPDAERDVLDIEEGDIVQAFIIPLKRETDDE